MKNILISAYTCCPNRGSEPGNGWNWIINYNDNNYKPFVLTSGMFKTEIENYVSKNKLNISFLYIDSLFALKIFKIPFFGDYLHYYIWLFNSRRYIKKMKMEDWKTYEFAHHVTYGSIRLGTPLYNIPVPVIIGPVGGGIPVHSSLRKYFGPYYISEWVKEKFSIFLGRINPAVKKSFRNANHIFYSNSYLKDFIEKYQPLSASQAYHVGLSEYFKMTFPSRCLNNGDINILWTGRMLPRKGLNLAIESFSRLTKAYSGSKKLKLLIAGTGTMQNNATALVKKYKLEKEIIFLGAIPHNVLVDYYIKSHVFLFPSLKDSCPMQIFEAMATGLPVVTLDHQGMTEQITPNTGIKVRVGDDVDYAGELSNAMLHIISNDDVFDLYSRSAFEHGQKQIWSRRIREFINNDLGGMINNKIPHSR